MPQCIHTLNTCNQDDDDGLQNQKRFTEEQQEESKIHAENLSTLGLFSLEKRHRSTDKQDLYGQKNQRKLPVPSFNARAMMIQMK